jgi:myo-inositol-1-phosphate synthase
MPKINNSGVKTRRRERAEEAHARYNALSVEERIALVNTRPGNSARELARLNALLEES